ncbi:transcription initiation factor TFIID subunit 8-like [Amphiura filiformis]|uniref:transcription initiation factor TFIID subunit 8-like n=1 Tax=Amphiura filiformis TaxID=82378 RepID=UPI003B20DA16
MTSTENSTLAAAHRKALVVSIGALCSELGFGSATESCVETLTEILQSYITELGRSARTYCELSGRTVPMVTDVSMAVVEMGVDVSALKTYAKRLSRSRIPHQDRARQPMNNNTLQVGEKNKHPTHIPEHLPPFPDPHTYIKTATFKEQETDYRVIREKASSQKRDVERALTRFIAKTGDTQTLFPGDSNLFPLIACTPSPLPYLDALMPPEHEMAERRQRRSHQLRLEQKQSSEETPEKNTVEESPSLPKPPGSPGASRSKSELKELKSSNPYLRKVKKPKGKRKKSFNY